MYLPFTHHKWGVEIGVTMYYWGGNERRNTKFMVHTLDIYTLYIYTYMMPNMSIFMYIIQSIYLSIYIKPFNIDQQYLVHAIMPLMVW